MYLQLEAWIMFRVISVVTNMIEAILHKHFLN